MWLLKAEVCLRELLLQELGRGCVWVTTKGGMALLLSGSDSKPRAMYFFVLQQFK